MKVYFERKLFKTGGSLALTIPEELVGILSIKEGDLVRVFLPDEQQDFKKGRFIILEVI